VRSEKSDIEQCIANGGSAICHRVSRILPRSERSTYGSNKGDQVDICQRASGQVGDERLLASLVARRCGIFTHYYQTSSFTSWRNEKLWYMMTRTRQVSGIVSIEMRSCFFSPDGQETLLQNLGGESRRVYPKLSRFFRGHRLGQRGSERHTHTHNSRQPKSSFLQDCFPNTTDTTTTHLLIGRGWITWSHSKWIMEIIPTRRPSTWSTEFL